MNAQRFFRGTQVTGADGRAKFRTIVPGWYTGRAVHIHVKAHPSATTRATTQVYFSEALLAAVYASEPYSQHSGAHIPYDQDNIYTQAKGPAPLTLVKQGSGYGTTFTMGIAV
ncbi:MAG: hypothetical protein ABIP21_07860 [Acidimicrobiia bacterium]